MLLRQVTRHTKHPFDVARNRDTFRRAAGVRDLQCTDLYWIVCSHTNFQRRMNVAVIVLEDRISVTVLDDVFRHLPDWCRGRCPYVARLVVAQINAITARIAYRVIVPRCDSVEEAALRPGTAASTFSYDKDGTRIRNNVLPRRGQKLGSDQPQLILAGIVEESESIRDTRIRGSLQCYRISRPASIPWRYRCVGPSCVILLIIRELEQRAESQSVASYVQSCHCTDQRDVIRFQHVGSANEHATGPIDQCSLARCHHC